MYGCVRYVGASFFVGLVGLTACVKVPDLKPIPNASPGEKPGSISIDEVVKRVKCEIRDSLVDRFNSHYALLDKWTITADLSLSVNDNSQISPGVVLTHQFLAGSIPNRVTNFSQSSSLGLGGQASTTASRTEIVSFSMSVKDIKREFFKHNRINSAAAAAYDGCLPYGAIPMDLTGTLGLKEWVDSALGPVDDQIGEKNGKPVYLLSEGVHPQAKGPQNGGGAVASGVKSDVQARISSLSEAPGGIPPDLKPSVDNALTAVATLKRLETTLDNDEANIKRLTDKQNAGEALTTTEGGSLREAQQHQKTVLSQQKIALQAINEVLPKLKKECPTDCNDVVSTLQDDQARLRAAIPKSPKPKLDPPIDAISHQVQFIIVYNASLNPTWTMLNFKGPSPTTGSFLSGTDTNTHTLTIVMGEPSSPASSNARSALTLSTAFQQATTAAAPAAAAAAGAPLF